MDWHKNCALCWLPPVSYFPIPPWAFYGHEHNKLLVLASVSGAALEGTQTKTGVGLQLGSNVLDGKTSFNISH